MQVILSTYNYSSGMVSAEGVMGDITVLATPIGNKIPHPAHSCGLAALVMCADMDIQSYIFIPWSEADNWGDNDFYSELCTVADGKVYDAVGNPLGDALPECLYHYAPTLKTLFCIGD